MQIAKGLHRIGSDIVNSYLVVDGGGVTIIDAGLPRYWTLLGRELARLGLTLDDVRALILTHGDTDHIGFAARLHREKGIPAYLHPADAARARLEVKKPNSGWGPVKVGPLAGFLWYSARQGGLRIPPGRRAAAGRGRPGARRPRRAPDHPRARPHARERRGPRPGGRRALHRRRHDDPQRAHRRDRAQARAVHARSRAGPASLGRISDVDATWVLPVTARPGTAAWPRPCGSPARRRRGEAINRARAGDHTGRAMLAVAFRSRQATGTTARISAPVRANATG